jgi:hypothetical protein
MNTTQPNIGRRFVATPRPIFGRLETSLPTEKKIFLSFWSDCLTSSNRESKRD